MVTAFNEQLNSKWVLLQSNRPTTQEKNAYNTWAGKVEFQHVKKNDKHEQRVELRRIVADRPLTHQFKLKEDMCNDDNIFKVEMATLNETDADAVQYPAIYMKWFRDDCIVTSTFVTQTNLQHLGVTTTQYNWAKKYELQPNQTNFTLSIFNKSDMSPVEFDDDGKDYIILECIFFRE
jgi:hypothetical protein